MSLRHKYQGCFKRGALRVISGAAHCVNSDQETPSKKTAGGDIASDRGPPRSTVLQEPLLIEFAVASIAAAMPVKFVASDADGLPVKRKQVQQACPSCRRRKKRCTHTSDNIHNSSHRNADSRPVRQPKFSHPPLSPLNLPPSPQSESHDVSSQEEASAEAASHLVELSTSRFVGDLNPEGVFIEATNYPLGTDLYRDRSDIGTWFLPPSSSDGSQRPTFERDLATRQALDRPAPANPEPSAWLQPSIMGRQSYRSEESSFLDRTRHTFIFQDCLNLLPPPPDFEQLKSLFLERIYPVLPVFNSADVAGEHPSKISRCIINQVIALAAATDPDASNHLRLENDGPLLSFQEFHQRLAHAIFAILDANMLISRVDHIRILIMISFFYQPSSTRERDMPCLLFSQAVHYSQSLGIQLLGYRPERQDENIEQLFCALWAMDRMMAAFYGRPCLLHERDIDRDLDDCINKQPPCFRLFLRVVQLLDGVIELYRPKKNRQAESIDLPVFEGMALDAGAAKSSPRILATIETFYHAVSVLSCRLPSSAFSPSASEQAHLPHPAINARRSLSADRIFMVVQSEAICSLPFIPYAVSMSLSVAYRKMRHSKVPMYRIRARTVFKDIVSLLKRLGEVYTTARVNASLGESILKEMEKTANSLTAPVDVVPTRSFSIPGQDGGQVMGEPIRITDGNIAAAGGLFDGSSQGDGSQMPLDPALLDNMDEIDLFGYFDRGFNLGAVDAALEANLDMGFPQNWTSQWYQAGS